MSPVTLSATIRGSGQIPCPRASSARARRQQKHRRAKSRSAKRDGTVEPQARTSVYRQDYVENCPFRLPFRPAATTGGRRPPQKIRQEREPSTLFGIPAGRDIAESGAGLRQTVEHSVSCPTSDRAQLKDAHRPRGPICRDLLQRIAQQPDIQSARRRRVEQMLRHRPKVGRLATAAVARIFGRSSAAAAAESELPNQIRCIREQQAPDFSTPGRSFVASIRHSDPVSAAPNRSSRRSAHSAISAEAGASKPVSTSFDH